MKTIILLAALFATGNSVITEVGEKILLKCGAGKVVGKLEWSHGSNLIYRVSASGHIFKGQTHIKGKSRLRTDDLEISNVEERDAGKFVCKANDRPFEQTLIVVSVSVVPSGQLQVGTEATLQCLVSDLDRTSTVEWKKPDGTLEKSNPVQLNPVALSHRGTWQLRVTNKDDQFIKNLSITVTDPTPPTPAPNQPVPEQPDSPNSKDGINPTCNSTCGPSGSTEGVGKLMLLGLIWWVWVAVGAGSLVVIVLIIVVIVTVMRIRKKKRVLKMKAMLVKPKKYCQCERQTAAPKPRQGRRREKPPALPLQPLLKEGHERGGRRANERENGERYQRR